MNLQTSATWILLWAKTMFGDVALNKRERALRMLEEACELAQAAGLSLEDCSTVSSRTWSREPDTVFKEVGGLLVTLLSFCAVFGVDPDEALRKEAIRITLKPAKHWRDKHDAKVAAGTTTGAST